MGDLVKLGSFLKDVIRAVHAPTGLKAAGSLGLAWRRHPLAVYTQTRSLLPGNTEGLTGTAGGLGSLTLNLEVPEVTETSVLADLLHALEILSESSINDVGVHLGPGAVFDAPLSVQEPLWNSVI